MYKILVIKTEPNPNYDKEIEEWKDEFGRRNPYNDFNDPRRNEIPRIEKNIKALETTLTDKEFEAVKKACISAI